MIDWNAVGRNGFVVKLPTVEAVDAFLEELHRELPQLSRPGRFVIDSLKEYTENAAMYIGCDGLREGLHWEYCYYDYFREHYPYNQCEFFEYGFGCQDLGDLGCVHEIDVCSLFSVEEVPL